MHCVYQPDVGWVFRAVIAGSAAIPFNFRNSVHHLDHHAQFIAVSARYTLSSLPVIEPSHSPLLGLFLSKINGSIYVRFRRQAPIPHGALAALAPEGANLLSGSWVQDRILRRHCIAAAGASWRERFSRLIVLPWDLRTKQHTIGRPVTRD